ncbi:DUF7845 domain-containing protein [Haloparvum sp. AD34]
MTDDFDVLEDADPVTSDEDDPVEADVEQPEADAERQHAGSHETPDVTSSPTPTEQPSQRWVAACRWCGSRFETPLSASSHSCSQKPVAACRFCGEVHTSADAADEHLYSCERFRRHHERQTRRERSKSRGEQRDSFSTGPYIDPWFHEFKAYVKYDVGTIRSYFGLNSLQKEHDFEEHGALRTSMEDEEGDSWGIEFSFKDSGLAPRDDPGFQIENVREYQVQIFPDQYDTHSEAKSDGRRVISFTLSPRWPDIESLGDASNLSNPHDIEGFDVEFNGSNVRFSRYPDLFHRAMVALRDKQGFKFSNPTFIDPDHFAREQIHHSSNITDAELYVRVKKDLTGQVYAFDGTLHRISMLLGDERHGFAKTVRDDRECPGHYHTATVGDDRASKIVGGHDLAKECKHYHVKNPDAVDGTPLENPKIGVSLQHSKSRETVYWDDLDSLERELDEVLLNVLSWSDIPTRPDSGVFVADDYFEVTGSSRFRKLITNQLPRIKAQQDRHLEAVVGNVTETDTRLLETLLTDGGQWSPADLADAIGRHIDTVYNALERLDGLVDHSYGDVQLGSTYLAQEIVGRVEGMKDAVKSNLKDAAGDLVRAKLFGDGDDPWSRWLDHYVDRVEENDDAPDELVLGYRPETKADAKRLLREGAGKWAQVAGEDALDFAMEFVPTVETADGQQLSPNRIGFQKMLPGYKRRYGATG